MQREKCYRLKCMSSRTHQHSALKEVTAPCMPYGSLLGSLAAQLASRCSVSLEMHSIDRIKTRTT